MPAGEFTRFKDAATGKTLVEAGSYHRIASSPLNPLKIPSAIYTGIVKSASTITFMLIIGGAFQVITSTGALTALCKKLSKTFSKHKYVVIPVFFDIVFYIRIHNGNVIRGYDIRSYRNYTCVILRT